MHHMDYDVGGREEITSAVIAIAVAAGVGFLAGAAVCVAAGVISGVLG